ncbi:putative aldouronate transport system substrate-binding protein [Evansella vedderi]|uniref:Aldouronate transport system substrate-binding protein n=1 Tax=Evansella vedderi TaxID=38282 RepID=A0ABT9ZRE9_9BACI|nr:extracellular solute-binding protein [Evansella vedderi]MDQ0253316.1 putative aldouronate transport system substrate-binding protein [Evansella vedderi]
MNKLLGLILAVVLIFGMLVACSDETDGTADGGDTDTPSNNTESDSDNEIVNEEPLEISMILPLFEEVPDMNNEYWTEFQERTNTKLNIEWVPSGDFNTKFDLVLSSGALPDVLWAPNINSPSLLRAINNGAFWEIGQFLGDFSNYPNLKENASPNAWRMMNMNGEIYGIGRNRPSIDQGIKIRKDWLDNLGLPVPTTLEEYADALEAMVKQDPNGTGRNDTIGYVHSYGGTGIHDAFAVGFGAFDPAFDEDGGLIHFNMHPAYVETVGYFADLYARGILPQEFASISRTQTQELFESGQAASYIRNIWRAWMFEESIKRHTPEAEVIVIELEGPAGPAVMLESGVFGALMLSHELSEEKVLRILDYFEQTNSHEFFHDIFYGYEGIHHELDDNGYPVMTELGEVQIGSSVQQPLPLTYNDWWKIVDKNAPEEYNERMLADTEHYAEIGKVNPFSYLRSETWVDAWPRYQNEWETRVVEAIVGNITMDEFEEYIENLRNLPQFKESFQEFAEAYEAFWE